MSRRVHQNRYNMSCIYSEYIVRVRFVLHHVVEEIDSWMKLQNSDPQIEVWEDDFEWIDDIV